MCILVHEHSHMYTHRTHTVHAQCMHIHVFTKYMHLFFLNLIVMYVNIIIEEGICLPVNVKLNLTRNVTIRRATYNQLGFTAALCFSSWFVSCIVMYLLFKRTIFMARRAIPMIAFPQVRTIYIYIFFFFFLCPLREYALYT